MKILFVHQNFPGQFLHLAPALVARGHDCLALTDVKNQRGSTLKTLKYTHKEQKVDPAACRLGRSYTTYSDRGVTVARAARSMREKGYVPDVMVISPFLTGCICRTYAAIFSFMAGVMPPMPMFGRSLLYVQSHCVA